MRTICLSLLLVTSILPGIAAETWQEQSRIAHAMSQADKLESALEKYDTAISLLRKSNGDVPTLMDLELNKANVLLQAGKLAEADKCLSSMHEPIMALHNDSLQMRYWRRLSALRAAQKRYSESVEIGFQNLQLIRQICGKNNTSVVSAAHQLVETSIDGNLWADFSKSFLELLNLYKDCKSTVNKKNMKTWLVQAIQRSSPMTEQQIRTGDLNEIANLLQTSDRIVKGLVPIRLWVSLLQQSTSQNKQVQELCLSHLLPATGVGNYNREDSKLVAQTCLLMSLKDVYEPKVSDETEHLLGAACHILESQRPPADLSRSLLYVQCKSLYAMALARRNNLTAAQNTLNTIKPNPAFIDDIHQLFGIIQARIALAEEYKKRGDLQAAKNQFQLQYQQIAAFPHIKDRDSQVKELKSREKQLLSNP